MSGDAEMTKENIMCVLASFPWPQQAQYNQLQEKRLLEPRGYGEFTPQLLGPWLLSLEQCSTLGCEGMAEKATHLVVAEKQTVCRKGGWNTSITPQRHTHNDLGSCTKPHLL